MGRSKRDNTASVKAAPPSLEDPIPRKSSQEPSSMSLRQDNKDNNSKIPAKVTPPKLQCKFVTNNSLHSAPKKNQQVDTTHDHVYVGCSEGGLWYLFVEHRMRPKQPSPLHGATREIEQLSSFAHQDNTEELTKETQKLIQDLAVTCVAYQADSHNPNKLEQYPTFSHSSGQKDSTQTWPVFIRALKDLKEDDPEAHEVWANSIMGAVKHFTMGYVPKLKLEANLTGTKRGFNHIGQLIVMRYAIDLARMCYSGATEGIILQNDEVMNQFFGSKITPLIQELHNKKQAKAKENKGSLSDQLKLPC